LPYFKLRDPDADAKVTVRDLLTHRIGLKAHDDGAWDGHPERSREDVIKITMAAKPTAKFRETFQYNNVMYAAAGECIAAAQHASWEDVIATRILAPLGMRSSAPSLKLLHAATDVAPLSIGYQPGKPPKPIPLQDISNVGPAGAIVSSARDMAQWLRVMLGGGVVDGRRVVSEAGFKELLTPQIRVSAEAEYGLGWGLAQWRGTRLITHTGGTDGFSALVDLLPDRHAGFVFLNNVPDLQLIKEIRAIVWEHLLDLHQ
jgi:CubicO group peptidase (beta-lactamase class C family)